MKSSLDKIFYKVVYHHIIYMCDFFGEFRRLFCRGLHGFSRRLWFALDMFLFKTEGVPHDRKYVFDNLGTTFQTKIVVIFSHKYLNWSPLAISPNQSSLLYHD